MSLEDKKELLKELRKQKNEQEEEKKIDTEINKLKYESSLLGKSLNKLKEIGKTLKL